MTNGIEVPLLPLADLADIERGISWDASQERRVAEQGTLPVLRIPNIKRDLDTENLLYLRVASRSAVERFLVPAGSIAMVGSNGNAERVGNVSFVTSNHQFLLASFLIGVRPRREMDPRYLYHILASSTIQDRITRSVQGSTGLKNLSKSYLRNLAMPVPPPKEQRKIADILDTADEVIRSAERLIAKLEQARQGLLYDLLTCGIGEHGRVLDPQASPAQFKDSILGPVPIAWSVGPLGSFLTLQRGYDITVAQQRPGQIPVVSSSGISSFHDRPMVKGPGVVIGRKGKLGGSYYLPGDYWPHDTSLWVKDFKGNYPKFIHLLLKFMRLERFDAATSVPTLNRNFVHPITVAVPPISEQRAIVRALQPWDERVRREIARLRKSELLKHGLVDDLMTGRVRVNVAEEAAV
ncbi:restriction endonuclease subunit S [Micromonospora sp. IBSANI012]|uniref:restriction endonuclease subunit S n=1 Tax=Micromonospora sp. IBSANI012 TaxID=3457761 RepID=UPI0040586B61